VKFGKLDRKAEVMQPYLQRQAASGIPGVAAIGVAQEYQNVFACSERVDRGYTGHQVWFTFHKADRRVTCFYFYLWDEEFGPGFIKICAYFPYPAKVWINGHEWAKQQARHAGVGFSELSNGFATCEDPAGLQAICDRLSPEDIDAFFDRWMSVLPVPLTDADRAAGYWWELSMRQVETSRTIVFDAPRHARSFFEALVVDNLDIGRPDRIEVIFAGHPRRWGRPGGGGADLQDADRDRGHDRGHGERRLQALPGQAVPQRRPRATDRVRDQRSRRPDLQTSPAASARAASQSPCRQRSPARY
jgi:hypothetical protein